jgi:hypothetical protein
MRVAAIVGVVGVLVGVLASIAFGALLEEDKRAAELRIEPTASSGPAGIGTLGHEDGRLTGWIVVWGLEPGSRHAVHFHGPGSACGTKADPVAVQPDLEAGRDGVATVRLDAAAPASVLDAACTTTSTRGRRARATTPRSPAGTSNERHSGGTASGGASTRRSRAAHLDPRELGAELLEAREVVSPSEEVDVRQRRLHPARERLVLGMLVEWVQPDDGVGEP